MGGCFQINFDFGGYDINLQADDTLVTSNKSITRSAEDCQELCQDTERCVWFVWNYNNGVCALKSKKGDPRYDKEAEGKISGPRKCGSK